MPTVKELQAAIDEKRKELRALEQDLPTFEKLQIQAHEDSLKARRAGNLTKRLELHTRHVQLAAVLAEQEDAVDDLRALISDLESELALAVESERLDAVAAWARQRNQEGAAAFQAALKHLQVAQAAFNEVHERVAGEVAAGGRGSVAERKLLRPVFPFRRVYLQGPAGRVPLERFVERLQASGLLRD